MRDDGKNRTLQEHSSAAAHRIARFGETNPQKAGEKPRETPRFQSECAVHLAAVPRHMAVCIPARPASDVGGIGATGIPKSRPPETKHRPLVNRPENICCCYGGLPVKAIQAVYTVHGLMPCIGLKCSGSMLCPRM
uniref:Uncharacterized protein n=1 Tax=Oryza glaberrima TaxID=4538 RepID=I1NTL4_ORYGL